jgi:hypothetical protein
VPLLELKIIVSKNSKKVRIYIINNSNNSYSSNNSYNSNYLIRSYSPNSDLDLDLDLEELVY